MNPSPGRFDSAHALGEQAERTTALQPLHRERDEEHVPPLAHAV